MTDRSNSPSRRRLGLAVALGAVAILAAWTLFRSKGERGAIAPLAKATVVDNAAPLTSTFVETVQPAVSTASRREADVEVVTLIPPSALVGGVLAGSVAFTDGSIPPPVLLKLERYEDESGAGTSHVADHDCVHEIHVTTDADGRFEAAGLCAGRYRAQAVSPQTMYANGLFDVPTSDARYVFAWYLLITRVVDSNREAVAGVHLAVEYEQDPDSYRPQPGTARWSRVTDAMGSFWQAVSEPGEVRLRVLGLGSDSPTDIVSLRTTPGVVHNDIWLPIAPSRTDLRVRLTACGGDGSPLRDYCFLLQPYESQDEALRFCSETADDGAFHSIPAGRYRLTLLDRHFGKEPAYYRGDSSSGWDVVLEVGGETLIAQCVELGGRVRLLVRSDPQTSTVTVEIDPTDEERDGGRRVSFREPLPGADSGRTSPSRWASNESRTSCSIPASTRCVSARPDTRISSCP